MALAYIEQLPRQTAAPTTQQVNWPDDRSYFDALRIFTAEPAKVQAIIDDLIHRQQSDGSWKSGPTSDADGDLRNEPGDSRHWFSTGGRAAFAVSVAALSANRSCNESPRSVGKYRAVEQFDGMTDDQFLPAGERFGFDLHGAADVAGDADVFAGRRDVTELSLCELRGHVGMLEVVRAGGAATDFAFGQWDDFQAGDLCQQFSRLGGDALCVGEVAGVVVGDGFVDRLLDRRQAKLEKHLADVADFACEVFGAVGVLRIVAKQNVVVLEHRAAAGDRRGDVRRR